MKLYYLNGYGDSLLNLMNYGTKWWGVCTELRKPVGTKSKRMEFCRSGGIFWKWKILLLNLFQISSWKGPWIANQLLANWFPKLYELSYPERYASSRMSGTVALDHGNLKVCIRRYLKNEEVTEYCSFLEFYMKMFFGMILSQSTNKNLLILWGSCWIAKSLSNCLMKI